MAWIASPPRLKAAKMANAAAKAAAPRSIGTCGKVRRVIRIPLRDPVRDPLRAVARGIFVHRGPWATASLGARARGGARSIVGSTAGPPQGRLLLESLWLNREALPVQIVLYAEAQAAARRMHMRLVHSLCGLSVGMGVVYLAVSLHERWAHLTPEARSPLANVEPCNIIRTSSGPLLDLLTRNLVSEKSRLSIEEVYTFASGPPLGVGAYGVVHRATHNGTGLERAVKCIDKQDVADRTMLRREVEALRVMDHPSICRLIEWFETDRYLWLVMELCRGEELCARLLDTPGGLVEAEAAHLMAQMLRATLHCHKRAVLHQDLKPENFLFKDVASGQGDALKLVDFGFCLPTPSSSSSSPKASVFANLPPVSSNETHSGGTLVYRSPQSLRGEPPSRSDDAWSLGVIFHILLTGQFPFSTNDDSRFQELCDRGWLQKDVNNHLKSLPASNAATDLARRLLAFDPDERISIETALRHPFIATKAEQSANHRLGAEDVYDRCVQFLRWPKLRRIAMAVAARLFVEETHADHTDRARATFDALDVRGDGWVALSELQAFFAAGGLHPPHSWFASLSSGWPALSVPHGISYTAFVAMTMGDTLVAGDERLCHAVFDMLDASGDGILSAKDLQLRLGLAPQHAEKVISEALDHLGEKSVSGHLTAAALQQLLNAPPVPESLHVELERPVSNRAAYAVTTPPWANSRENVALLCAMLPL